MKHFPFTAFVRAPFNVDAEEALKLRLGIYLKDVASKEYVVPFGKRWFKVRNTGPRFECELRRQALS